MRKSASISRIAIFCRDDHHSLCDVLHFAICPIRNSTNLGSYPVVIASIIYGPRTGAILGLPHGTL